MVNSFDQFYFIGAYFDNFEGKILSLNDVVYFGYALTFIQNKSTDGLGSFSLSGRFRPKVSLAFFYIYSSGENVFVIRYLLGDDGCGIMFIFNVA